MGLLRCEKRIFWRAAGLALALSVVLACACDAASARVTPAVASGLPPVFHSPFHRHVCGPPTPRSAHCHADVVTDSSGTPEASSGPSGYVPSDLQSAYALAAASAQKGAGETVALVDAYNDPNAEADLGVYRSQFGLPACTTANGCFKKVNQAGGTTYPASNVGWSEEIALDLDMVSAICPNCHILLVEAASNSFANLGPAVDEAATLGATQISNSYGGSEFSGEQLSADSHYYHPGIAVTASAGDNGYGVEFPAASQYVTAVGGTTLTKNSSSPRGWSETVWSGTGSGCSAYMPKPSWQTDAGCSNRTVSDVAADADPNTGVAVYDSYGQNGWLEFGGTSAASPIVASTYALIGSAAAANYGQYPYLHTTWFNNITSGSNGSCGSYLCQGGVGYNGPTGIGTPSGVSHPPVVSTGASSAVGTTSAAIAGAVNPNGQATTYQFDYGTSMSYGSQSPAPPDPSVGAGTTSQQESATLTGLSPGMTYHYRIEATNSSGTTYGSDQMFTTAAGVTLSASPASVSGGGAVTVTWNGVGAPTSADWVGLYTPGAANSAYLDWFWADSCTKTQGTAALASGSCSYTMPATPGSYELRLFTNNTYTVLAASNTVTVTGTAAALTASPSNVAGGGSVTVSWSGVAGPTSADWIGLYHPGDANTAYTDWIWADSCTKTQGTTALASGSCTYTMPATPGSYELRLLSNNTYTVLATSNTVTVTSAATLTASPSSIAGGGSVTLSWSGVASPTSADWIGLYHPGDANTAYTDWIWANSCTRTQGTAALASGSCSYTMPATAGSYELRLFSNNTYTVIATSNTVTVTGTAATLTASPSSIAGGGSETVSWSGVASPTSADWIGLYHPGDANTAYTDWIWADSCTKTQGVTALASGSCTYTMPTTAGSYQLRLFTNNTYTVLATSNTVTVN